MNKQLLLSKITASKTDISDAEERLASVIRDVEVAPRAEKTVSEAVDEAMKKLKAARAELESLEKIVLSEG
jgi:chemotaxis regulatin CheY-phosphate phosphatase CheZ